MRALLTLSAVTTAIVSLAVLGASPSVNAGSTKAAYYTSAQSAAGAKQYQENCSRCHGAKLEGMSGPALKGSAMAGSQTVADIYGFMSQQMPAGAPGSLSSATYTAIMAYLLAQNGHPAGSKPLTPSIAKKITAKI